ncbi:WXG100 family type VII secretion target [Actinomadura montaniterrae]|uniref:WXG100 family type VII secretion target n=1 Tax=Actinomadura montaniterrae TaxID=1803903 RepID=A0A6L3VM98_9ACTN|nr:WXG100 family type VII secretion target [Actinomadura montaniterrae]KAB2373325.1 WXG100 family type VII secretion target [Actinomadura montaniterrae]
MFTPTIDILLRRVGEISPPAAATGRQLIASLWGDPGHIKKAADAWATAKVDATTRITNVLDNDMQKLSTDHWSGEAKEAYTAWMETLRKQALDPLQEAFGKVEEQLNTTAKIIDDTHWQIEQMAGSLLAAIVAGLRAAGTEGADIAADLGILAAIGKFIHSLYILWHDCTTKFGEVANSLRTAIPDIGTPVRGQPMIPPVNGVQIPIYATGREPAPDPSGIIGDWGNWGTADPVPGS